MSSPNELPNNPPPTVKDKNPHNYRKVGYSMIVISVSLVIIGLLSWGLADDYHFSSNIMALQEVDAMTPKSGYNIVLFDISQPVGAKLKMLDHGDTLEDALSLQSQDAQQNTGSTVQVLLFNASNGYNLNLMRDAEVYVQTPKTGYNVILDSYPLAVGAQLTLASHEGSLDNATAYEKQQEDQIQGQEVKVMIFTSTFTDNLKMATGSDIPVGAYALVANQTNTASNMTQTTNQTIATANTTSSNSTNLSAISSNATTTQTSIASNQTASVAANTTVTSVNQTASIASNKTITANQTVNTTNNNTATITTKSNQTNATLPTSVINNAPAASVQTNATSTNTNTTATTNTQNNAMIIISSGASNTKGSCTATDCFNPQTVNIQVGGTITWTNDDTVGHTATSGKITDNQTGTIFDSSLINAGKSYTSPPFQTAGTYDYFCQVHPWMTGQIIVGSIGSTNQQSTNGTVATKSVNLNETVNINATGK